MKKKMFLATVSLFVLVALVVIIGSNRYELPSVKAYEGSVYDLQNVAESSYEAYKTTYPQVFPSAEVVVDATTNYTHEGGQFDQTAYVDSFLSKNGVYVPETGQIHWDFTVSQAGYYSIYVEYLAVEGRSSEISRGIMINDRYPFQEAQNFVLSRIWEDEYNVEDTRVEGKHDLKPKQQEKLRWSTSPVRDTQGYYSGISYQFYFVAGNNTITFVGDREPVVIANLILKQETPVLSYADKLAELTAQSIPVIGKASFDETGYVKVQGENPFEKSSPILSPVANWSSYKVDPYVKFLTRYNTIGGTTWRVAGDWISWEIEVPETGLYELTFKVLQNYDRGMFSTRILYVNGEVPFEEARNIQFAYNSDWQNVTLGNEDGAYLFYLEEGTQVISMEATIGVYREIVSRTEQTISTLNTLYRKVVMIAGVNPDKYQDYMLEQRIDGLYSMIDESIENLAYAKNQIIEIAGARSGLISSFERTIFQLNKFKQSEKNIQEGLNELDDNISALGAWVMNISEQSLAIDVIYLHGDEVELPKAHTNFFQKLWHEFVMLLGSYGANTSLESSIEVDGPTITVWIASGRDQSQLLRQLIDDSFTAQNNINVELKLVAQTALLPATLSGNGPDVALGVMQNIPVNWGIRNAVVDYTQFSDFSTVASWFHESAITPFAFDGAVYGLPDTHDFLIGFSRTDVVEELELNVPTTWQEVVDTLPTLQRQYLDYYLPNTKGALSTLLYAMIVQNGGQLYSGDGKETLLTEPNATDAFIDFTTFFSHYGFEISASFPNRFRSGEMPMGVFNYSLYNTLSVFAPEIRGQWEFTPLPGYKDEENVLHNQTTATSTGTIILDDSKEKEAAWTFVKWWLGEEAQTGYGRGMEAILGAAARYPTANLEAFANLPWSTKDYLALTSQREVAVGVPTVPGDYIVGRYIDNAFRASVNDNTNPRENLFDYAEKINIELTRKRQEFNLN